MTGRQLRAARVLLGWEQVELAYRSHVAVGTIRRMEAFSDAIGSRTSTLALVQATLEKAGIRFLSEGGPGVQLQPATTSEVHLRNSILPQKPPVDISLRRH